jgi:hypothetical protein
LRTIGDLKAVSQIAASVYGVDMAIPARPQKSEGLVPLTAAVVEELLRANLELDERRGLSKALALFEILTTMETAAPVEPFRLSEELDEPVRERDIVAMSKADRHIADGRDACRLQPNVQDSQVSRREREASAQRALGCPPPTVRRGNANAYFCRRRPASRSRRHRR